MDKLVLSAVCLLLLFASIAAYNNDVTTDVSIVQVPE